jgi:hypothetical protein
MDRRELVLSALAAAGENATFLPVQVQKLFFVLDREAARSTGGPHFNFQAYDYGPFDQSVYGMLEHLERQGLARVQSQGRYRQYMLTAEGYREGAKLLAGLQPSVSEYLRQLAAWIRSLSFQQLVAAIYNRYPDMKVNSVFRG